jgi:hypothetical protein
LAAATALGLAISLGPIDPIKAFYWTAVINGLIAVPVMTVISDLNHRPYIRRLK